MNPTNKKNLRCVILHVKGQEIEFYVVEYEIQCTNRSYRFKPRIHCQEQCRTAWTGLSKEMLATTIYSRIGLTKETFLGWILQSFIIYKI